MVGASILVAGAYALKQLVGPYAVRCYRRLYGIPDEPAQESDEHKTAELLAAAIASQVGIWMTQLIADFNLALSCEKC